MALRLWPVLSIVLAAAAMIGPARAQMPAPGSATGRMPKPGQVSIITSCDVADAATKPTADALRQFAAAARKEDGTPGFVALEEIARPARFATVEVWRDKPGLEAHGASVAALRDKLQAAFASPFDIRINAGLSVAGPAIGSEPGGGNPVYVLTHVDVFPAGKDQTLELLKQLAEPSRKEAGNLRFDVLQPDGRANHRPLLQSWH